MPPVHHLAVWLVSSAALTWVATPLAAALSRRLGAVDEPAARRTHQGSKPRMGGLAVFGGFLAGLVAAAALGWPVPAGGGSLLLAMVLLVAVGAADDIGGVDPRGRLVVQLAGAVLAVTAGVCFDVASLLVPAGTPRLVVTLVNSVFTTGWIVGMTNAMNLMDGLDFVITGFCLIASAALATIALAEGRPALLPVYLCVMGALIGFSPHNIHPSRVFLGDSGSTFLGYTVCVAAVMETGPVDASAARLVVPMVLLGIPLFDTLYAIGRRLAMGRSPLCADRGHIHHRLLGVGLPHGSAGRILVSAAGVLALAAVVFRTLDARGQGILLAILLAGLAAVIRGLELFSPAVVRQGFDPPPPAAAPGPTHAVRQACSVSGSDGT